MTSNGENQSKPPLFQRIKAQNLLSFGPDGIDLELGPLNVLIGPNGSGKSNLLELFSLLQASPTNLVAPVRNSGGVSEWIWKGAPEGVPELEVEVSLASPWGALLSTNPGSVGHMISFNRGIFEQFTLIDEKIWLKHLSPVSSQYAYQRIGNKAILQTRDPENPVQIDATDVKSDESILSQRKDPVHYPELSHLNWIYGQIRIYRDWQFGLGNELRRPQDIHVLPTPLAENYLNLGVFLGRLKQHPATKRRLIERLRDVYQGVSDFELGYVGNTVQIYFTEGDYNVSATRLSDGSLRYLCLLAILLDPEPPEFIAIDEPELGLHPDLMPQIVDLLVDASTRTQLVVTTHNDTIIDALNDRPETIVVCEKHDGQTEFKRLDRAELSHWLEKYRLGELWTKGAIGGTRW